MTKLPPLNEVDKDLVDHGTTTLKFKRCKHEIKQLSSTEACCVKCSAGWTGPDIKRLVDASKLENL